MYVYLTSEPSRHYPENTGVDFTAQLPFAISDVQECGVVEVRLPSGPRKPYFLCCDLCVESITNSKTLPVLTRVGQKTFLPSFVTYTPLRVQSFNTIRLYLCTESGEQADLTGVTRVTLHLK